MVAEALGKGTISVKPTKTKDQVEKEKYLFKRRDESIQKKSKKASSGQPGPSPHPLLVVEPSGYQASIRPSEGSRKHVEGAPKKAKGKKRPAGELNAENANLVVKKKKIKKTNTDTGGKLGQFSVAVSNGAVARENVSGTPLHVPLIDKDRKSVV